MMQQDSAETTALKVLAWLVQEEEILPVFLGASGISPDELRARAGSREVLAAVLDFVTMDDAWVMACAEATGLDPRAPMMAKEVMAGPAASHWT